MSTPLRPSVWSATLLGIIGGLVACGVLTANAAECPPVPTTTQARRALAKEWFTRGEAQAAAGDYVAASKAYDCSMKMIAHAVTAYNLARVAETAGDLELALGAYRSYLTLQPDASDRVNVEGRIKTLEDRVTSVRGPDAPVPSQPVVAAPPPPLPVLAPPTTGLGQAEGVGAAGQPARVSPMGLPEWIAAGVGVVAVIAGISFNLAARNHMEQCHALSNDRQFSAALSACSDGKRDANVSYVLLGAAGAAAVFDVARLLWKSRSKDTVSLSWSSRAAILTATTRF